MVRPIERVSILQGLYYVLTSLWALADIQSFVAVTGPKTDIWLVRTVAVLILAIGIALLTAGFRRSVGPDTMVLALATALGLAAIEGYYSGRGRISALYGADAILQLLFAWAWISLSRPRHPRFHDVPPRVLR
jgi:hypothetical protein